LPENIVNSSSVNILKNRLDLRYTIGDFNMLCRKFVFDLLHEKEENSRKQAKETM